MENSADRLSEEDVDPTAKLTIEDITVMKLMEEIVEFDSEIKMKQKWINSRIKMLHEVQKKQKKKEMKGLINDFLKKI